MRKVDDDNDYDNDDAQIMLKLLKHMKFITINNITCTVHPNDRTAAARYTYGTQFVAIVRKYSNTNNNSNNKH